VIGPVFNDDFGDVYGSIYALSADGFSPKNCASTPTRAPAPAACARRGQGGVFGAQAEKVFVEISQKRLAQLGLDMNQVIAQMARRTRWKARAC
jgi:multidrug efflux pump